MDIHQLHPRGDADFDLYPYIPSKPAASIFLALFCASGGVHLVMMIMFRSWFFIPLILGCAGEAAGYYGRTVSSTNIRNGGAYLLQLMLILASAPLIAATIYMTLGRLIYALDARDFAIMSPRWTTKIYVLIDIASFVAQLAGSAMQASGDPAGVKTGNTIVVAGLGIQVGALVFFILNTAVFHHRLSRDPTATAMRKHVHWKRHLWTLYSVCVLIIVRSVFRLAEFVEGPGSNAYRTEAYMYVFDAALMFLVTVALGLVHPGMVLRAVRKAELGELGAGDNGIYLLRASEGER